MSFWTKISLIPVMILSRMFSDFLNEEKMTITLQTYTMGYGNSKIQERKWLLRRRMA